MNYLMRYKGKYRLKVPYDLRTNQFNRKLDGTLEDIDVYIDCYNDVKIFHYGGKILQAYFPSIGRGRNVIKRIKEDGCEGMIFDIMENDEEVMFSFKSTDDVIFNYLKPKTSGAGISPFSEKNLPKNKDFSIPEEDMELYRAAVANVPKDKILTISRITNDFIKSLANRRNPLDKIKADMKLKCLKGKDYIYSIGKWNEYIAFLKEE